MAAHDRHVGPSGSTIRLGAVARTPLGMAMAVFFGLQSTAAYTIFGWFAQLWRDSGYSPAQAGALVGLVARSEEHTSELQSLMRISYAVFCLKKKKVTSKTTNTQIQKRSRLEIQTATQVM